MTGPGAAVEVRVMLVLATSTGGVGRHVASLVAGARDAGTPVAVAGPADTDPMFGFTASGAEFFPVDIGSAVRPAQDLRAVRALAAAARRWAPTVVHAHGLRAGAVAVAARPRRRGRLPGPGSPPGTAGPLAPPGRRPLVVSWHNAVLTGGMGGRLSRVLERRVARGADLVLGASADLVARARELGAPQARLGAVAAPPPRPSQREPAQVRAELGAGDRPLLLAVGRLAPQKDYPTMLAAASRWATADPAPLLAIVGGGPLREELQTRIDADDLPVRLLGVRDDVADLLAAADAMLLSSTWEARALVAQEALRAGVPLVATAVGGIPELVGDAAVLVPPGNPDALANGVRRVLTDPELAARLSAAGRMKAATWPDEAAVQAEALDLYRRMSGT